VSGPSIIWCSCGNWWYGGEDGITEHMAAHLWHQWWPAHAYPPPIGPPWPPMHDDDDERVRDARPH